MKKLLIALLLVSCTPKYFPIGTNSIIVSKEKISNQKFDSLLNSENWGKVINGVYMQIKGDTIIRAMISDSTEITKRVDKKK